MSNKPLGIKIKQIRTPPYKVKIKADRSLKKKTLSNDLPSGSNLPKWFLYFLPTASSRMSGHAGRLGHGQAGSVHVNTGHTAVFLHWLHVKFNQNWKTQTKNKLLFDNFVPFYLTA